MRVFDCAHLLPLQGARDAHDARGDTRKRMRKLRTVWRGC